jgi:hypothetical protein
MVRALPRASSGKVDRTRLAGPDGIDQLTGEQVDRLLTALTRP